jgi:hypothetical protein
MGHVTRAFINRFLSLSMDPPPKRQASPRYVVLVKRAEGRPRSMTNFVEVESMVVRELSPWDVEAVTHQGGTLLDQLALFGGAIGVLGPHGAGLSPILAMDEGRYEFVHVFFSLILAMDEGSYACIA